MKETFTAYRAAVSLRAAVAAEEQFALAASSDDLPLFASLAAIDTFGRCHLETSLSPS